MEHKNPLSVSTTKGSVDYTSFRPVSLVRPVLKSKRSIPSVKSAECSLCKYVVSYLDAVLQNNKSEAAIEAALEKVCGILPAVIKANCVKFVDTYGPILAQLLVKYTTPDQVCNALKVCTNGTQSIHSGNIGEVSSRKKTSSVYRFGRAQNRCFCHQICRMFTMQIHRELLGCRPSKQQI